MKLFALNLGIFLSLFISFCSDKKSDTTTEVTESSGDISVGTPSNFESILSESINLTPTTKTSIADRDRILLKSGNSYASIDSDFDIVLDGSIATYQGFLEKTFYLVEESGSSCYRMDSELHGIYSVDYDTNSKRVTLNNAWGYGRGASSGFLCFTFNTSTNVITASKRFKFNTTTSEFDEDGTFTAMDISYDSANSYFVLGNSSSAITIQSSGFDFDLPTDFNPNNDAIVSNTRVDWESLNIQTYTENNLTSDKLYKDTYSSYQDQVKTRGKDDDTQEAAETMLTQIKSDLEASGGSLRYDPSVYLAFREAMLNTTLQGASIVNGELGQNTAPYFFFTNESDDNGVRHPFMVFGTYSITDKPNNLLDVPAPPGSGIGDGYENQQVTRDAVLQTYLLKIPLKDYGVVTDFTSNTMENTLADDVNESTYTIYNYASVNYIGVAIDGVMIYPVLNNTLTSAQKKAELSSVGNHVGRGMGLHWHADGHSATGNGLNLYNISDYEGLTHPPLIGFGMDGIALYGKYESAYSTMDGYSDELDSFGSHSHGSYGVHYHAHTASSSVLADTVDYTLHILMKGAWKGSINDIPEFWGNASQENRYVGSSRSITALTK